MLLSALGLTAGILRGEDPNGVNLEPGKADVAASQPSHVNATGGRDDASRIGAPSTTQPASQPHGAAPRRPSIEIPALADDDLLFLGRNARMAFRAKAMGQSEGVARYHPESLAGLRGIIHLTMRSNGAVKAEAESAEMDIVDASIAAGTLLGQNVIDKKLPVDSSLDSMGIEFEWLGPTEYLHVPCFKDEGVWTDELLHSFEPAVEGIGVEFRGQRGVTRPSLVLTLGYTPDLALAAAEKQIGLRSIHKIRFGREIRYFRFWSYGLWQPTANDLPIVLHRGDRLIEPGSIHRKTLDAAIQRIGAYLLYRQNSNGEFSHEYVPSTGTYADGNSARVQLRALHGLAVYAEQSKDARIDERLLRGIGAFEMHLKPLLAMEAGAEGQAVEKQVGLILAPAGHSGHLEISSRLLSAMMMSRHRENYGKPCAGLISGILASQQENGFIQVTGEAAPGAPAKPPSVSECLRAIQVLEQANRVRKDPKVTAALERSISFFRDHLDAASDPIAAAELVRALCLHYPSTNDARVSDMAFFVADQFSNRQLNRENCEFMELWGAIGMRKPGEIGIDTAAYLSALSDACRLAKRIGDGVRVERYRQATMAAARFVIQLEFRDAGCYFVRSRQDVLGGIRAAPWNNRLRVDHTALALESLLSARETLFGSKAP